MTPLRTVDEVYAPKQNVIGALRLLFAALVVVSHAAPLGFGADAPLLRLSGGQLDLGTLSVYGFFVLSGFLIAGSARRQRLRDYALARFLRIFPGYWACLLLTALVLAPLMWHARHGSLDGLWSARTSPLGYVGHNLSTHVNQYGIGGMLLDSPYGRLVDADVLNGSLWTLRYELVAYLVVAVLAVVGALGRRRWLTLAGAGLLWLAALGLWVAGLADADLLRRLPDVPLPVLGPLEVENLVALLLVFAVGTVAAVAPGRFPLDRRLAVLALVVAAVTLVGGGFGPFGAPAFAYLVLWLSALRTPHLTRVGVKVDVSYGLYIYAFPVQQLLATSRLPAAGRWVFVLVSLVLSLLAGTASWYAVERPFMRLKQRRDRRLRAAAQAAVTDPVDATPARATEPA
ncbi:acyltransferase family protein [Angustibacter aerolatus]